MADVRHYEGYGNRLSLDQVDSQNDLPAEQDDAQALEAAGETTAHSVSTGPLSVPVHSGGLEPVHSGGLEPVHSGGLEPVHSGDLEPVHSGGLEPHNPRSRKGPRKAILVGVKKSICEQAAANPSWNLEQLANWANVAHGLALNKRAVFDILGDKEKWLAANPAVAGSKRLREAAYPELERRLGTFVSEMKTQGETIKTEELRARALEIAREMNISKFSASNGWIHRFLKRQSTLSAFPVHEVMSPSSLKGLLGAPGDSADEQEAREQAVDPLMQLSAETSRASKRVSLDSAAMAGEGKPGSFRAQLERSIMLVDASRDGLNRARDQVRQAIMLLRLDRKDVFTLDEAGLFYTSPPSQAAVSNLGSPSVPPPPRLTLAFCCNACGTERLKPLLVGSSQHPRSFGEAFDPSPYVHYFWNSFAAMTSPIFNQWLNKMDNEMKQTGRSIALILDVASFHGVTINGALHTELAGLKAVQLKAITLIYLPTCTAQGAALQSLGQPLEQGIISMFKVKFRKQLMQWVLCKHETEGLPERPVQDIRPSVRDALVWCAGIWAGMDPAFVSRCWDNSGLLPPADDSSRGMYLRPLEEINREMGALQQLIDRFGFQDPLDPVAYASMAVEEESALRVGREEREAPEAGDVDSPAPPAVSAYVADQYLEAVTNFAQENPQVFAPAAVFELNQLRLCLQKEILSDCPMV